MSWVEFQNVSDVLSPETEIRALWQEYLTGVLGIPKVQAEERINAEVLANLHVGLLDSLESRGWTLADATVLDVGCGTGALAIQLVLRGARVIGVEPSYAWGAAAQRRLQELDFSNHNQVVIGDGSQIPLANSSIDYVLSLQVLEHVPIEVAIQIIKEMARVLRPGGRAYLSFENYFSFWEPHYGVRWLPYLPKLLGTIYLQRLGRDPSFLQEHVYYNSAFRLAKTCHDAGLVSSDWLLLIDKLEKPDSVQGFLQRQIAKAIHLLPMSWRETLAIIYAERSKWLRTSYRLEITRD